VTGTGADQYAATWACVYLGSHSGHGGWHSQEEPVCMCGAGLVPEGEAAA
jgi:hypothetical protein